MKILIVEDEQTIREVEQAYLERAGFIVIEASDGKQGLELAKQEEPDLIILDLNLPSISGLEICKQIRRFSQVPIMMVTARVEELDELIGLETGADDYIRKPFSPGILVARVQSLLRRLGGDVLQIGKLEIDPQKMQVKESGEEIVLTTTQFNILYTLAKSPGRVFTRDQIMNEAYADKILHDILDRTVDAHIKSIRKSLGETEYIVTMIGKGYKFNDKV